MISAPYLLPVLDRYRPLLQAAGLDVLVAEVRERLSPAELMPFAGLVDGVVCGDDRFSQEVLQAFAPRLKVISKWGTGIDSIDRQAAEMLGIRVCNTPDAFTDAVADSVMAYVLAFARQIVSLNQDMKSGQWRKLPGKALQETSLGVIGVGRIGKAVLRRAAGFGMTLLGNDILAVPDEFVQQVGAQILPLADLLRRSDFISLNCDLNPTSFHLLDRSTLAMTRPGAVVINTARGAVIDEQALIEALQSGHLGGAGLDVFEDEPLPVDSPLLQMDQVLLAPHNANSSPQAWERVHRNTLRNMFEGLGLEPPKALG
jgi:D-3-phosphoglycerate dehydrogenase / 2-oxoglutarate reductase